MERERELVVQTAGALPVVKALCEQLGLVEAVDRFCPIRGIADYTHGEVVLALVANRLTDPRPLCDFVAWGERFAVAETLGIAPCKLNDDRLGRALDALAEHLDEVLNLLGRRAIERFGIELAELHWDLTHLAFSGSYEEQEEGYPRVKRGRTPDNSFVHQVRVGHWVTRDGGLPLPGRSFDGNTNDVSAVEPALERLDALRAGLASGPAPLVIGDSKLLSEANLAALERRRLRFLCPHAKDEPLSRRLAELKEEAFAPLGYRAERHREGPARYLAQEGTLSLGGRELRALFVLSYDDRAAASQQRAKQLGRAEEELAKLNGGVPRYTKSAEELERKARSILERRGVAELVGLLIEEEESGRPRARIERDRAAIEAAMRLDGRYCLVTNDRSLSADELFAAYKRQHLIENRFTDFKGPLKVRPLFLQSNKRIAALVAIIGLALLLYGLIERRVRSALASLSARERRLLAQRIGRATGRKILDQLSDLPAVRIRDGPLRIAPRPAQDVLLRLFGL